MKNQHNQNYDYFADHRGNINFASENSYSNGQNKVPLYAQQHQRENEQANIINVLPVVNQIQYVDRTDYQQNKERMKFVTLTSIIDCLIFIVFNIIFIKTIFVYALILMGVQSAVFIFVLVFFCSNDRISNQQVFNIRNLMASFMMLYFLLGSIFTIVLYFQNNGVISSFYEATLFYCLRTVLFLLPQFAVYIRTRQQSREPGRMYMQI